MIHIFPDGAAQYDADVGEPPGNNLQVRVEDGFKIVSPRGQKFDLKKGTAIGILGTHLNELHPSFNGDDFVLSPDDPSTLANCQLEALDRWSGQHNSNGELPFNVELFTDIFQRIIPDGRRVLEMQEFQVEHCDPNRIASDRMEATILAQTEGYDINPALGPLPLKDGLDQSQIETARQKVLLYRMAEKRVQSLAHHLVRHRPNATVFIAHSDKDVNAHLTVKDPASKLYNYWHSDCFEPHELQPLNNNYLSSVGRAIPRIRIAPAHYITSENMDIPTGFNGEFIEDGPFASNAPLT